ncbi:MAG: AbrB/MazE/SpoVT family DNA-binding domain-containing protein [Thermaceae bacterium]|nr:AbrB/MazE/SpoVT family DNA-binding domain-containing protein [Thermaceae bacterium]
MSKGTLSSKNQITIPIEMVRALGLRPGDQLEFTLEDGTITLKPQRMSLEAAFAKYSTDLSAETGGNAAKHVRSMRGWDEWGKK